MKYQAFVNSIYDGDTITCTIYLGLGVVLKEQHLRLYGINAPEKRGNTKVDGERSQARLMGRLIGRGVELETINDRRGKYGRLLVIVWLSENNEKININEWMVEEGYAVKYLTNLEKKRDPNEVIPPEMKRCE